MLSKVRLEEGVEHKRGESAYDATPPVFLTDWCWCPWKRPFGRFHCTINRPTPPTGVTSPPKSASPLSSKSDGNTTTGPITLHPDFRECIQLLNDHSVRCLVVGDMQWAQWGKIYSGAVALCSLDSPELAAGPKRFALSSNWDVHFGLTQNRRQGQGHVG